MQKLCIMLHNCGSTSNIAVLCSLKFLNVLFLSQVLFKKNSCGLVDFFFFSCRRTWGQGGGCGEGEKRAFVFLGYAPMYFGHIFDFTEIFTLCFFFHNDLFSIYRIPLQSFLFSLVVK